MTEASAGTIWHIVPFCYHSFRKILVRIYIRKVSIFKWSDAFVGRVAITIANFLTLRCSHGKSSVFLQQINNLSGYPEFVEKHVLSYSYQLPSGAKMFRRDQGKVVNVNW